MKVTCPQCGTSYNLTAKQVGPAGRTLQCAKCKHKWFVAPALAAEAPRAAAPEADTPPLPPSAMPAMDELASIGSGPLWWRRVRVGWGPEFTLTLAGVIVAGMAIGGFNWLLRYTPPEDDAATADTTGKGATHQPGPQPGGLVLSNLSREVAQNAGNTLLIIHGNVTNATSDTTPLPDLRVQLLDRDGIELDYWPVSYVSGTLAPRQSTRWQVTFVNPPLARVAAYRAFFGSGPGNASDATNLLDTQPSQE